MRLLEPLSLTTLALATRVVMSQHRSGREALVRDAERIGPCLVVTAPLVVDPRAVPDGPRDLALVDLHDVAGWRAVVRRVHAAGGQLFALLSHPGRAGLPALPGNDLVDVVAHFVRAARLAREAGFDGVEVHGACGHLIDQLLRSGSNRRRDAFGGSLERRVRFLLDVTEAISTVWPVQRLGVRLSPWSGCGEAHDRRPRTTFLHAAAALDQLGIAYLHVVEPFGQARSVLRDVRRHFGGAVVVAGGDAPGQAEAALSQGLADCVAFADLDALALVRGGKLQPEGLN